MKRSSIYIFILLILFIFLITGCQNKSSSNYISISKDDHLVKQALSYFQYSINDKKELMQKVFDNNTDQITVDDLTNEEKMFLVLEEYDRLNDGCIYSQIGRLCSFTKDDIKNLVFNNTDFIDTYMENRKYASILGIDLIYNANIFQAQGSLNASEEKRVVYFNVTEAKKNDTELIIDFTMAYLEFTYDEENNEIITYYQNIADENCLLTKVNDSLERTDFGNLDETLFNKFRYTLEINEDNVYFISLKKL